MASGYLSGQRELGSGGKVIRGRPRFLPSFSPYSRPPSSATLIPHSSVPEAQSGRILGRLKGIISGVGKLFLSLLGDEDTSPSPSDCFSNSDENPDSNPNEHEDQLCSDDLTAFKMGESEVGRNVESLAIFPKSETKVVIEQLLMQETFTRDEFNKLVEIIQSRVPDINSVGEGTQNVVPMRVTNQGQSFNHNRNLYGISNFSPGVLSSFSPRFYSKEAVFPDLRNKAVMEAKKWFEEKKLSPSPTYDRSYGPCILNTRMNQCGFEDVGSPIDMAKSYMQSLPPWRSPSFRTNFLKMSPSCRDRTFNFGSHLLPSPEVEKTDYLAIGSFNSEENHRTYLKSLDNELEFSELGQSKLLSRLSVNEASTIAAKTCNEVQDKWLELQDGNAAGADQLMETDNSISVGAMLLPKEVFKESSEGPKVAESNNIEQVHYDTVNMLPNDADMSADMSVSDNVEMPLPAEELVGGSILAPQDSRVFASLAERNNGDSFPETETLQLENITPAQPSINKNSSDDVKIQAINSIQADFDAAFNNTHPITDSELPDENPQTQEEAIGSGEKFETSSNFAEINSMKSDFESMRKGNPTPTSSSYGGAPSASLSEGTLEPASDVSIGIRRTRAKSAARKAQSTNMESVEPMLTEPPESGRGNKRKAKKIVKQKKWRG